MKVQRRSGVNLKNEQKRSKKKKSDLKKTSLSSNNTEVAPSDIKMILDNTSDAIISTDNDFKINSWNAAAERIYGYKKVEVLGKDVGEVTKIEYPNDKSDNVISFFAKHGYWKGEVQQSTKDGQVLNIQASVSLVKDESGNQVGAVSVNRDITDQKQAENALQESEEKYRNLVDRADEGVSIIQDSKIVYVNPQVLNILGYSYDEFIGKTMLDFIHPEQREMAMNFYSARMEGKAMPGIYELTLLHKDGSKVFTEISGGVISYKGQPADLALVRDITERKRISEALRKSEEKYRSFVQNFNGIAYRANLEKWVPLFFHGSVEEITGYNETDFIEGHPSWYEIIHPDDIGNLGFKEEILTIPNFAGEREYRIVCKSGDVRWMREYFQNISDDSGKPTHLQGTIFDITERKRVAEALRKSEEKFSKAFAVTPTMMMITKMPDGRIIDVNETCIETFGYSREDLLGKTTVELGLWSDPEVRQNIFKDLMNSKSVKDIEIELKTKSGEKRIIMFSAEKTDLNDEEPYLISVGYDITGKKRTEQALKASEERAKAQYKGIPIPTYTWQKLADDFVLVDYNHAALDITEGKIKEHIGKKLTEMYKDQPQIRDEIYSCFRDKSMHRNEMPYRFKTTGEERYLRVHYAYVPPDLVMVHTEDVTEQKLVENAVLESEEKFRTLAEESPNMIFINKDGRVVYANKKCEEVMGYTREEFYSEDFNFMDLVDPKFMDYVKGKYEKHMNGAGLLNYEYGIISKNGSHIDVIIASQLINYEGEKAILGIITDISDRKRAEEALKDSEERFRGIYEQSPIAIEIYDSNGILIDANSECLKLFGVDSVEEVKGFKLFEDPNLNEDIKRDLRSGNQVKYESEFDFELVKKHKLFKTSRSGKCFIDILIAPLGAVEGRSPMGYLVQAMDITERKHAEVKTIEERNRANLYLDLLSHDINNLNQAIISSNELLLMKFGKYDDNRKYSKIALEQSKAISDLINNVHKLSELHEDKIDFEKIDISTVIKNSIERAEKIYPGREIKFDHKIPSSGLIVKGNQLIQDVFDNVICNAVKFNQNDVVNVEVAHTVLENDGLLRLEVKDNGPGVPDEIKARIFERLARGDESIHGSGLGLTIAHEVVSRTGGKIWVEDKINGDRTQGSNFVVLLPRGDII